MKRLTAATMWAAVVCLALAPAALAQGRGGGARGGNRAGVRPGGGGPVGGAFNPADNLRSALAQLNLTPDQKTQADQAVQKFTEERRAATETNAAKLQDLRTQMAAAQQANDEAKLTQLRQEMRALFGGDAMNRLREQLKGLLTPEQNVRLDELLAQARRGRMPLRLLGDQVLSNAEALGLTPDQKARIEDLVRLVRDLIAKSDADVKALLTGEQNAKLEKLQAEQQAGPFQGRFQGGMGGGGQRGGGQRGGTAGGTGSGA